MFGAMYDLAGRYLVQAPEATFQASAQPMREANLAQCLGLQWIPALGLPRFPVYQVFLSCRSFVCGFLAYHTSDLVSLLRLYIFYCLRLSILYCIFHPLLTDLGDSRMLPVLTTRQVILRLRAAERVGFADLSNADLREVDMYDPEIRNLLGKITLSAAEGNRDTTIYIDLSGSDISGLDFGGLDLSGAILTRVRAVRTIFAQANLADTQMDHADVSHADFREANLGFTKLFETVISGANFTGADLQKTLGLGFSAGNEVNILQRLSEVSSIMGAKLPPHVEALRPRIQALIRNRQKTFAPNAPARWEEEDEASAPKGSTTVPVE